jgi:AraC-like DNA-binding protein
VEIHLILLLFITGIFGTTVSSIILKNYKSNQAINIYFILFMMVISFTQLGMGLNLLFFKKAILTNFYFESSISVLILPIIYLYFKNLSNKKYKVTTSRIILHSIFPLLYFVVVLFKNCLRSRSSHFCFNDIIIYYFFSAFVLIYIYFCSVIVYKNIWDIKREHQSQFKNVLISKWTKFIYLEIIIITFAPLILYWFKDLKETDSIYQPISCIILLIMCCKIVCCPEIFYGYTHLKSKISESENPPIKFGSIWNLSNKDVPHNLQDQILKGKIDQSLAEYISQIEFLILNDNFFFRSDIKIEHLSAELKIPKSHLNYIFKYHSKVTFIEFKKIIKIHYATVLIKNNYLQTNTLNYLSKEVGFASYDPFYRSFKKHTGNTPLDYHNLVRANK